MWRRQAASLQLNSIPWRKTCGARINESGSHWFQVIQVVTFFSRSWRSPTTFERVRDHHPKKVTSRIARNSYSYYRWIELVDWWNCTCTLLQPLAVSFQGRIDLNMDNDSLRWIKCKSVYDVKAYVIHYFIQNCTLQFSKSPNSLFYIWARQDLCQGKSHMRKSHI